MDINIEEFKLYFLIAAIKNKRDPVSVDTMRLLTSAISNHFNLNSDQSSEEVKKMVKDIDQFHEYSMKDMVFQKREYPVKIFFLYIVFLCNLYNFKHPEDKVRDIEIQGIEAVITMYPKYDNRVEVERLREDFKVKLQYFLDLTNV